MEKAINIKEDYFPTKKILLVTENSTDKTTWRKIFTDLGVVSSNLLTTNTMSEACTFLQNNDIDFVFSSFSLNNRSTTPLIQKHLSQMLVNTISMASL